MKKNKDNVCDLAKRYFRRHWQQPAMIAGALIGGAALVSGEGFRNPPPGAFNLGRAGGRIAHIDDSSAIHQNPAQLVTLTNAEVQFTPSIVYLTAEYKSPSGEKSESTDPWYILPNIFASAPFYDGNLALGLGVTAPYGLGSKWDRDSAAFARPAGAWRYQATYSAELKTLNFNPTISLKAGERVRFGAGVDVMWSEVTLQQFYPWFLVTQNFADPDGNVKADATGVGVGANLGLSVDITDRQRVAFTVRTPMRINYEGDFEVSKVPAALGGGTMKGDFATSIKFPTIVAVGYGIQVTDDIRLEANVEWLQFSNFKKLPIKSSTAAALGYPASIEQNWKDTFTIGIGGDWRFAEAWTLRAGYQYYESPVPDSTFSPTIPDANQNVFTVGLAYQHHRHAFEGAYGLDFYDTRKISNAQNPAFNGKYEITVHLFSLAYRYSF